MQEVMQKILEEIEFIKPSDITNLEEICEDAYYFTVKNKELFMVCNEKGAENILKDYREASIEAAKHDIPEVYQDFFEFNEFAEESWQSIYDIYSNVTEVNKDNIKYFICSV